MVSFIPPIKILIWGWFMTLFYPHEFVILSRKYRRKKCVYTYIYISHEYSQVMAAGEWENYDKRMEIELPN
jgi:hypothetical protein